MTGRAILRGADSADYYRAKQKTSRVIDFSDGNARHITLETRYWDAFDRLQSERGWRRDQITELALNASQKSIPSKTPSSGAAVADDPSSDTAKHAVSHER